MEDGGVPELHEELSKNSQFYDVSLMTLYAVFFFLNNCFNFPKKGKKAFWKGGS